MVAARRALKIIYVGTFPPHPGGSAISCSQLLAALAGLGHSVRALAPITAEACQAGDIRSSRHPDIDVTRFPTQYFETCSYTPPPDWYRRREGEQVKEKLTTLIAADRPDIIFIGRETFTWHVPDLARAHSIPSILTVRGGVTFALFDGSYPEALARQILGEFRKVNRIVTQAQHMADGLRGLGLDTITVIPNAIDLRQFLPKPKSLSLLRELSIHNDEIVVMHVSNLKALKRPLDLVYSAERALRQNPKLVYVIVGDGQLRAAMEEACRQKRLSERFRFVGWVEYDSMPDYINLADLVIMPSEAESQARVYLETQACARLLLTSDIPAAREVVVDGETGILFRKGDIDDLTAKTLLAAGNPDLRAAIGRRALERVKCHSLDEAVAGHVATIEEVVRQYSA